LFILGTERHEARRIDNQLRGRAGRQGDPGETRFYLAFTDDIMRLFGSERILGMLDSIGLEEDMPIDKKMFSDAIESSQRRVESRNFQSRKNVLEYDDVMNKQRTLIYEQRQKVLDGDDIRDNIQSMISEVISNAVGTVFGEHSRLTDPALLSEALAPLTSLFIRKGEIKLPASGYTRNELEELLEEKAKAVYSAKENDLGFVEGKNTPIMRELERYVMLRVVDEYWMEHIDAMENLRDSVRLRAYSQINPVDEYKREGFEMFEAMVNGMKEEVVRRIFTTNVKKGNTLQHQGVARNMRAQAQNVGGDASVKPQSVRKGQKIGPNDPCPCGKLRPNGNGLPMKYKNCCGRNA